MHYDFVQEKYRGIVLKHSLLALAIWNIRGVVILGLSISALVSSPLIAAESDLVETAPVSTWTFPAGGFPRSIAVGDFNNDGKADLAVANQVGDNVTVRINDTASFDSAPSFSRTTAFASGLTPSAVAVGDFNQDKKLDLAVANFASGNVIIHLNQTAVGALAPSFIKAATIKAGLEPHYVSVADFNGDDKPDLAIANHGSDNVTVQFNNTPSGASALAFGKPGELSVGKGPVFVAVGDLNGDLRPDLVTANSRDDNVTVLINDTVKNGPFPSFKGKAHFTVGGFPISVAVGDLNGDGLPDLAVSNQTERNISFWFNSTSKQSDTPSFSDPVDINNDGGAGAILTSDLNADKKPDLLIVDHGANRLMLRLNNSGKDNAAMLTATTEVTTGTGPRGAAVADFNGDGKPDVAIANQGSDSISVWMNQLAAGAAESNNFETGKEPAFVLVADFNRDGKSDFMVANKESSSLTLRLNDTKAGASHASFTESVDIAAGRSPSHMAVADFNRDDQPDLVVVGDYGATVMINDIAAKGYPHSFTQTRLFPESRETKSVTVDDFNGDGRLDFATAHSTGDAAIWLNEMSAGSENPSFSGPARYRTDGQPASIASADFNGDGIPELITANSGDKTITLRLNETERGATVSSFDRSASILSERQNVAIAVGEFNNDGKVDFVVVDNKGIVKVRVNDLPTAGSPNEMDNFAEPERFGAHTPIFDNASGYFKTGIEPKPIAVGDFNCDGKSDLVLTTRESGSSNIMVRLNDTGLIDASDAGQSTVGYFSADVIIPTFTHSAELLIGWHPSSVAMGDFNGDGRPDLVVTNPKSDNVTVWINALRAGYSSCKVIGRPRGLEAISLRSTEAKSVQPTARHTSKSQLPPTHVISP